MSTSTSATDFDASNASSAKLLVAVALGFGGALLIIRLPSWIAYITSDRAWSGLCLTGHHDPRKKYQSGFNSKPPRTRHVSPLIAHGRTLYNSFLLPSVAWGFSVGQCLLMTAWGGFVIAALFMNNDLSQNVRSVPRLAFFLLRILQPKRGGHIALAHVPLVVILCCKHSLVGLVGKSYVEANFMHRHLGRTLFVCAAVHATFYLLVAPFKSSGDAAMRAWGKGAMGSLSLIVATSVRLFRRRLFKTFATIHLLGFAGFLVCVMMHVPQEKAKVWILSAIGLLALDIVLRIVMTRVRTARMIAEEGGFTRIRIEDLEDGWRAGQFVRIRVRKNLLGFESHPITIANAPSTCFLGRPRGLLLHVHASGDWSKKLRAAARADSERDDYSYLGGKMRKPLIVQVTCEGPYGAPHWDLSDSEGALIVCGGSGISYGLALLEGTLGRALQNRCRIENLVFLWTVRDHGMIVAFASEVNRLISLCDDTPSLSIRIHLHLTGNRPPPELRRIITTASIFYERPNLDNIVKLVVESTLGEKGRRGLCKGGIAVVGCGPQAMMDGLRHACSVAKYNDAVQSGGLVVRTESFGL